jgi:hypothetical protein
VLFGGLGQDQLSGEDGADSLYGEGGDDTLSGGNQNDFLNGGGLHDQCSGGSGVNTFTLCQNQTPAALTATFSTVLDWGGGFCQVLSVTNPTPGFAINYAVVFDTHGASIYHSWNASLTTSAGLTTAVPSASFNTTLDPGETDDSIGICANRTTLGSAVASVVSTSATY